MKHLFLVGAGGFLGSIARYSMSLFTTKYISTIFPTGTFLVNIMGSFIIGFLYAYLEKYPQHEIYRFFLVTGFCGGFTTFSSFSAENLFLLQKGHYTLFFIYVISSILLCLLFVYFGTLTNKFF